MKSFKFLPLFLALAAAFAGLTGCASLEAPNTESLLSAAGFRTKTPSTPKQIAFYDNLDSYQLQRHVIKGRTFYTYADKMHDVIYFGGEKAYQSYRQLALKQEIAEDKVAAAEMNEEAAFEWDDWGPMWGGFWD